jgi:hypothetical protein
MIYLVLIILSLVMVGTTVCILFKAGEKENICNYGYIERNDEK